MHFQEHFLQFRFPLGPQFGRAVLLFFTAFYHVLSTAALPVDVKKCELSLKEQYLGNQHWIDYGSMKLTVRSGFDGDDLVVLEAQDEMNRTKHYEVSNPEQRQKLAQYFFANTAPEGSRLVIVNYPKIGKGLAYRGLKEGIYLKSLVADKDGVIQIPGLPPFYERKIGDKVYVDIPHPDVFNAYIGRKFFVSYTSSDFGRFPGEIPGPNYVDIVSHDRFPISNVKSDWFILAHDVLGHAIVMASVHDHDIWKRTVAVSNRAIAIQKSLDSNRIGRKLAREIDEKADWVLLHLAFWEGAANRSGFSYARTQPQLEIEISKLAKKAKPSLDAAEKGLGDLELAFEKAQSSASK